MEIVWSRYGKEKKGDQGNEEKIENSDNRSLIDEVAACGDAERKA